MVPVSVQEFVLTPATLQESVAVISNGESTTEVSESDALGRGSETVTAFVHCAVLGRPTEVMVTEAILVPIEVYVFATDLVVPESELVPLQE